MILRKPYAFLIKYFKLINGILALLTIYITYRTYNIVSFFNDYITSDYTGNFYAGFSSNYISTFIYFIIILIIAGLLVIILLFIYKKKPLKTYATSLGYYIIFLVFLIFIKNTMVTLETTVISAEAARAYRDLSLISIVPQILFIILFLIRTFGFNTKSLNFEADLKDLQIESSDDEEVEITFERDNTKLKRTIRRFKREFKYYIRENKFIFILLCVIGTIGVGFLLYLSLPEIIDKEYVQGETFDAEGLVYRIEDSIITNLDYKGDVINEDSYYLVVKLYIENNQDDDYEFDINNFRLELGNNYLYPLKDKILYFIDYASNNVKTKVRANTSYSYSLIYEISKNDIKKNYQIKVNNGTNISDKLQIGRFNYITISPTIIDKIVEEKEYLLNDEVNLINSNLQETTVVFSNLEITDKYIYDYELCQYGICNNYKNQVSINYLENDKTLMVLDYSFELDKNIPYYTFSNTFTSFVNNFIKVRYLDGDNNIYDTVKNVTPNNLEGKMVLEVNKKVKETKELALIIRIRNKEYVINLK